MVLLVVAAVAAASWFTVGALSCDRPTAVSVVAAPDVAPFLDRAASDLLARGTCATFTVDARSDSAAAESLVLSDGSAPPQVWVPTSTLTLGRAVGLGARGLPEQGTSVGSSPMVLALAPDAAARLGWPDVRPTWYDVVGDPSIALGVPDPARDPLGMTALLEIRSASSVADDPASAFTATLRRLASQTTPDVTDLFDRLPGRPGADRPVEAFPTSELAVLRHNVRDPALPLTAVYPQSTRGALDFPFTVLDNASPEQRGAAEALLAQLLSRSGSLALAEGGFRTPQGVVLRERPEDRRTFPGVLGFGPMTENGTTADVLANWAIVHRSARALILLDVSGSMNAPIPGLDMTRMAATMQATVDGLALFQPETRLGYWTFSTRLDGDRDYRELLPVTPVAELRTEPNLAVLRSVTATADGGTGLYDTVLAAYRDAQAGWEAGRLNLVIVMTDGNDDDSAGISQEQLLAELAGSADPARPVAIMGVALGPDVDPQELTTITEATGGQTLVAADPGRIDDVFFAGLSALRGDTAD